MRPRSSTETVQPMIGPMVAFVIASTITPGPNSIMIMASAVNYGFHRTLPHIFGVAVGITLVISLAGLGLQALLDLFPALWLALTPLFSCYLLYLAWKIATAAQPGGSDATGTPLSFFQAVLFQWVNPKVWALGLTALTLFAPQYELHEVLLVPTTFALVGIASNTLWAGAGTYIARLLMSPRRLRVFNLCAALALLLSLLPGLL